MLIGKHFKYSTIHYTRVQHLIDDILLFLHPVT